MNALFHYYTVYYLAEQAGFSADDSFTIAYSSQYLDNALVPYEVRTDEGTYETLPTHHFGFWDKSREWTVWIPYHFFPGGPEANSPEVRVAADGSRSRMAARRHDGSTNPLNVVADSARVKELLVSALRTRNLYRVGIALHTYADSWAHQNFSGRNEEWNRVDARSPLPPIGHAQKLRDPDRVDASWRDPRILGNEARVDGRKRQLEAAGRIYRYLATFNRRSFADEELVISNLERILGTGDKPHDERIADFVIECNMEEYRRTHWRSEAFAGEGATLDPGNGELDSTMDRILWLKNELLHRTELLKKHPVSGKPGFYESNLYRWDQAARAHLSRAREILSDLLPANEGQIRS